MYIYMYICTYVYTHIYTYGFLYPISPCHRIHRHTRCHVRKRRAKPVYMYINIYIYLHMYVCVCIYIHTYLYIYAYTLIIKKTHYIVLFTDLCLPIHRHKRCFQQLHHPFAQKYVFGDNFLAGKYNEPDRTQRLEIFSKKQPYSLS